MIDVVLVAVIMIQAIFHYCERRDLYDRLMSKDLSEYKKSGSPPPKQVPSAHDRVMKNWRNKVGDE